MVSIRGVKFKFSAGERVLCYEPDPTKAKVLYESKVLELVVSRDHRGRKVAEYLIHFFGWNSSWDRCVKEEFILSFTEENRDLQTKLAKEAALSIKGKRKCKLPLQFKDSPNKKQCTDSGNEKTESSIDSSTELDSSEDEDAEKEVNLDLPNVLQKILEEDYYYVTQQNKLVTLPCQPNVIDILESYITHLASKLLCVSPPRNGTSRKNLMPEDVEKKLNVSKEVVDGIRVYFDFTLPHLLLYRQEKKQFYTDGMSFSPSNDVFVRSQPELILQPMLKIETEPSKDVIPMKSEPKSPTSPKKVRGRPSLRNQVSKESHSPVKQEILSPRDVKEEIREKSPLFHSPPKSSQLRKKKLRPASTRVLRSTDRQSAGKEPDSNQLSDQDPLPEPTSEILIPQTRVTRKSLQQSSLSPSSGHRVDKSNSNASPTNNFPRSPTYEKNILHIHTANSTPLLSSRSSQYSSPTFHSPTLSHTSKTPQSHQRSNNSTSQALSNCVSSSNSSSRSSVSNPAYGKQYHLINAGLLEEVSSWKLLPPKVYNQTPLAPSLIYGAQHLLRLFVKLPSLISKMSIRQKKMKLLLLEIEAFILYLVDQKDQLFDSSTYIEVLDTSNHNFSK